MPFLYCRFVGRENVRDPFLISSSFKADLPHLQCNRLSLLRARAVTLSWLFRGKRQRDSSCSSSLFSGLRLLIAIQTSGDLFRHHNTDAFPRLPFQSEGRFRLASDRRPEFLLFSSETMPWASAWRSQTQFPDSLGFHRALHPKLAGPTSSVVSFASWGRLRRTRN
jgi:hypothetical protein